MVRVSTRVYTVILAACFAVAIVFAAVQPAAAHAPMRMGHPKETHSMAGECDRDCGGIQNTAECLKYCLSSSATTPLSGAIAAPQFMKTYGVTPYHFLLPKHRPILSSGLIRPPPHGKRAWRDVHLKTQKRE